MKRCLKKLLDVFGKLKRLNMKTIVIKLILYQKMLDQTNSGISLLSSGKLLFLVTQKISI